jgi:diguanylate cyclase (GGDEF)-like protein
VQQRQAKSLMLVPVLHHGQMTGMLYLENNAVAGVFTAARVEVLHLLAAQTAISIENARLYAEMEQRVAQRTAELQALSLYDALTGVANRRAFNERLADELSRVRRHGFPLSLLMFEIDHFKQISDTYGQSVGEHCLQRIGAAFKAMPRRPSDFIARYGGGEFAILLPHTDLPAAAVFAERALETVRAIVLEVDQVRHPVTASVGAAVACSGGSTDFAALIACADHRLNAAKVQGRNRIVSGEAEPGRSSEVPTAAA